MKAEPTKRPDWFLVHFDSPEMLLLDKLAGTYKEPKPTTVSRIMTAGLNLHKFTVFPTKDQDIT